VHAVGVLEDGYLGRIFILDDLDDASGGDGVAPDFEAEFGGEFAEAAKFGFGVVGGCCWRGEGADTGDTVYVGE